MKKLCAVICLISFLNCNAALAIEEIIKKDPGIIQLPKISKIDKKAFKEKMQQDERQYQKVKALARSYNLMRGEDGKITANISSKSLTDEEKEYKEVNDSWIEGYYLFYKTADRIIRANNLDTQNWRFEIKDKSDDFNAYANAANHVVLYSAAADTFIDNEDALAFLIGHEMSHHILGHSQKNTKAYDRIEKLNNGMAYSIAFFWLIIPPFIGLGYYLKQRVWYARIRKNEIEADTEGLKLMARAGYDTNYANDVFSAIVQLGEHEKNYTNTHPRNSERIKNINEQIALLNIDELRREGENNLYEKPVLKLKRSSDKKSIVLIPEKNRGSVHYSKMTPQQLIINKAYSEYLNDNMIKSAALFEEAYKLNKKNYVPCLYLSYINEYNYKKTKDENYLKQAQKWADRAYKKNNADRNTIKQKMEVYGL